MAAPFESPATPKSLRPALLTAAAFAPYGTVIEAAGAPLTINYGHTERFNNLAEIDAGDGGGQPIVSIFRSTPLPAPIEIKVMERHPLGSQTFVPLSGGPYLVAVAPPGDFKPESLQVFLARADQGVHYNKGVWHHYLLALESTSDFLVIDRAGPGINLDENELQANERRYIEL